MKNTEAELLQAADRFDPYHPGQSAPGQTAQRQSGHVISQRSGLKIAVLSDLHYISPELLKDTEDFHIHRNSDRKMYAESEAFLNALLLTLKKDEPDVLLISGDLTKDGELENHRALAVILEKFREESGAKVYLVPGNHDLNNSNGVNFNTADGKAVPAERTSQRDFMEVYGDLIYEDETVFDVFEPGMGKQGGGLSYAARPKEGFTLIAIDSARYSPDNTKSGKNEHETGGRISPELVRWVCTHIRAAKRRGDTVIGLEHHGLVAHFSMEPKVLPMYLIADFRRIAEEFADAGMSYIFTGHMHANDISTMTTERGNTICDIETGSVVTYPSPARLVTIVRSVGGGTVSEQTDVRTHLHISAGTFRNPKTGKYQTVRDITEYGRSRGFTDVMLSTTASGFLDQVYAEKIAKTGSEQLLTGLISRLWKAEGSSLENIIADVLPKSFPEKPGKGNPLTVCYDRNTRSVRILAVKGLIRVEAEITPESIAGTISGLFDRLNHLDKKTRDRLVRETVGDLTEIEVARDRGRKRTLLDFANYIYQSHLGGGESGRQYWALDARAYLWSGSVTDHIVDRLIFHGISLLAVLLRGMQVQELFRLRTGARRKKRGIRDGRGAFSPAGERSASGGKEKTALVTVTDMSPLARMVIRSFLRSTRGHGFFRRKKESGFSLGQMIDSVNRSGGLMKHVHIDLTGLIRELSGNAADLRKKADEEKIGVVKDPEYRRKFAEFGGRFADSMSRDIHYSDDNNTKLFLQWKLEPDIMAKTPLNTVSGHRIPDEEGNLSA